MTKYYYTLQDLVEKTLGVAWPEDLDVGKTHSGPPGTWLYMIHSNLFDTIPSAINQDASDNLFCIEIAPQYKNKFIGYVYDEADEEQLYKEWWRKFLFVLNTSYDKYSKLIELNESIKNNLLDAITSVSESKFNDTPQNIQQSYDWSDDDHLTNVSRTSTSADVTSKIARLDEVNRLLKDFYDEWAKEFERLFIYE